MVRAAQKFVHMFLFLFLAHHANTYGKVIFSEPKYIGFNTLNV